MSLNSRNFWFESAFIGDVYIALEKNQILHYYDNRRTNLKHSSNSLFVSNQ